MDVEEQVRRWRRARAAELVLLGVGADEAVAQMRAEEPRVRARLAWVEDRMAALKAAQAALQAAWDRQLDAYPDVDWDDPDAPKPPDPPEQAAFDAIHAEIMAVCKHDRWPRHLHFGDV